MGQVKSVDVAAERGLIDVRELYRAIQDKLIALLASLAPDDWSRPTVLPNWNVHDVALHLLGGDIGRVSTASTNARDRAEQSFDELAALIEESNEEWVGAARRIAPALVVELLEMFAERLSRVYERADLWASATSVAWTGVGPSPLWLDLAREYTERWTHQQQIREAIGAPLLTARRWLFPVLDVSMLALPRAYDNVPAEIGTSVNVVATGDAGGTWHVVRGAERWHLRSGGTDGASARLVVPAERAWRWLARLTAAESPAGTVATEGPESLWRPALCAVAVMTTTRLSP